MVQGYIGKEACRLEQHHAPKTTRKKKKRNGEKYRSIKHIPYYKLVDAFILSFAAVCDRCISRHLYWNVVFVYSSWKYFSPMCLTNFPEVSIASLAPKSALPSSSALS